MNSMQGNELCCTVLSASTLVLTDYSTCNQVFSDVKKFFFLLSRNHFPAETHLKDQL